MRRQKQRRRGACSKDAPLQRPPPDHVAVQNILGNDEGEPGRAVEHHVHGRRHPREKQRPGLPLDRASSDPPFDPPRLQDIDEKMVAHHVSRHLRAPLEPEARGGDLHEPNLPQGAGEEPAFETVRIRLGDLDRSRT